MFFPCSLLTSLLDQFGIFNDGKCPFHSSISNEPIPFTSARRTEEGAGAIGILQDGRVREIWIGADKSGITRLVLVCGVLEAINVIVFMIPCASIQYP
jgi:hypothetical protein